MALKGPAKYLGQLEKDDDRFMKGYDHLDQFTGIEIDGQKMFIGTFISVQYVSKLDPGNGLESFGKPDFAQLFRIFRTRNKGPILLVLWYYLYSEKFDNVPFKIHPEEFPPFTERDVICDVRKTPFYGQIYRDSIESISSMVRVNYMDDPVQMMDITKTKYCCRFTLRLVNDQTVLEPYYKRTSLDGHIFASKQLSSTLGSQKLLKKDKNQPQPSTSKEPDSPITKRRNVKQLQQEELLDEELSSSPRKKKGLPPKKVAFNEQEDSSDEELFSDSPVKKNRSSVVEKSARRKATRSKNRAAEESSGSESEELPSPKKKQEKKTVPSRSQNNKSSTAENSSSPKKQTAAAQKKVANKKQNESSDEDSSSDESPVLTRMTRRKNNVEKGSSGSESEALSSPKKKQEKKTLPSRSQNNKKSSIAEKSSSPKKQNSAPAKKVANKKQEESSDEDISSDGSTLPKGMVTRTKKKAAEVEKSSSSELEASPPPKKKQQKKTLPSHLALLDSPRKRKLFKHEDHSDSFFEMEEDKPMTASQIVQAKLKLAPRFTRAASKPGPKSSKKGQSFLERAVEVESEDEKTQPFAVSKTATRQAKKTRQQHKAAEIAAEAKEVFEFEQNDGVIVVDPKKGIDLYSSSEAEHIAGDKSDSSDELFSQKKKIAKPKSKVLTPKKKIWEEKNSGVASPEKEADEKISEEEQDADHDETNQLPAELPSAELNAEDASTKAVEDENMASAVEESDDELFSPKKSKTNQLPEDPPAAESSDSETEETDPKMHRSWAGDGSVKAQLHRRFSLRSPAKMTPKTNIDLQMSESDKEDDPPPRQSPRKKLAKKSIDGPSVSKSPTKKAAGKIDEILLDSSESEEQLPVRQSPRKKSTIALSSDESSNKPSKKRTSHKTAAGDSSDQDEPQPKKSKPSVTSEISMPTQKTMTSPSKSMRLFRSKVVLEKLEILKKVSRTPEPPASGSKPRKLNLDDSDSDVSFSADRKGVEVKNLKRPALKKTTLSQMMANDSSNDADSPSEVSATKKSSSAAQRETDSESEEGELKQMSSMLDMLVSQPTQPPASTRKSLRSTVNLISMLSENVDPQANEGENSENGPEAVFSDCLKLLASAKHLKKEAENVSSTTFTPIIRPEGAPIGTSVTVALPLPSPNTQDDVFTTPTSSPQGRPKTPPDDPEPNQQTPRKDPSTPEPQVPQSSQSLLQQSIANLKKNIWGSDTQEQALDEELLEAGEFSPQRMTRSAEKLRQKASVSTLDIDAVLEKVVNNSKGKNKKSINTGGELTRLDGQCLTQLMERDVPRAGSDDEPAPKQEPSKEIPREKPELDINLVHDGVRRKLGLNQPLLDRGDQTASEVDESDGEIASPKRAFPSILRPKKVPVVEEEPISIPNLPAEGSAKKPRKEKLVVKTDDQIRINGRKTDISKILVASPAKDGSLKMRIRTPDKAAPSFQERMAAAGSPDKHTPKKPGRQSSSKELPTKRLGLDTSPSKATPEKPISKKRGRSSMSNLSPSKPVSKTPTRAKSEEKGTPSKDTPKRRGRPPKTPTPSKATPEKETPGRGRRSLQLNTPSKSPARKRVSVAPRMETVHEEKTPSKIKKPIKVAATPENVRRSARPKRATTPSFLGEFSDDDDDFKEATPKKRGPGRPAFKTSIETPRVGRGRLKKNADTPSKSSVNTPRRTPGRARRIAVEESDIGEQKMPGREEQMANIQDFIESRIEDKSGGCMYISGLPGTGKTASVNQVLRNLLTMRENDECDFKLIQVSGMELTQPQQVFCRMAEILLESKMTPAIAQASLTKLFAKNDKKRPSTILVIDELDMLCTKKQDVVYHLFDWPTKASSKLIVLTIANTMDLPERLLQGKVTSRMGLTRLTFRPYTFDQLEKIVQVKLGEAGDFDRDARQLVARKVASLSGDARRALEICKRALELVTEEKGKTVQMPHVMTALKEMLESPIVEAIKNLSPLEKLFLECMAGEIQRTGVEETTLGEVLKAMRASGIYHGVTDFTNSKISEICARLASSRLVLAEQDRAGIKQRISLNVNTDDLHYALKVQI